MEAPPYLADNLHSPLAIFIQPSLLTAQFVSAHRLQEKWLVQRQCSSSNPSSCTLIRNVSVFSPTRSGKFWDILLLGLDHFLKKPPNSSVILPLKDILCNLGCLCSLRVNIAPNLMKVVRESGRLRHVEVNFSCIG